MEVDTMGYSDCGILFKVNADQLKLLHDVPNDGRRTPIFNESLTPPKDGQGKACRSSTPAPSDVSAAAHAVAKLLFTNFEDATWQTAVKTHVDVLFVCGTLTCLLHHHSHHHRHHHCRQHITPPPSPLTYSECLSQGTRPRHRDATTPFGRRHCSTAATPPPQHHCCYTTTVTTPLPLHHRSYTTSAIRWPSQPSAHHTFEHM